MSYAQHAARVSSIACTFLRAGARDPAPARGVRDVLRLLEFLTLPRNEILVAPYIHDLWSARLFAAGFKLGARFDAEARRHDMLKPLECFSVKEHRFELALAAGDLRVLRSQIARSFRLEPASAPPSAPYPCAGIARGVAWLVEDRAFMRTAACAIHASWQDVRRSLRLVVADPRADAPVDALSPAARQRLLTNLRVDLEALPLAAADLSRAMAS